MSKKEQVSMFIDDTTLSEILSLLPFKGYQVTNEKMVLNPKKTTKE
jgi:hypothetical protein